MFSLPVDYLAVSFNLPGAFIHYLSINFTESRPKCFKQSSFFCQKILIMSALVKMTRLESRCNGTNCGSICWRHFHLGHKSDLENNLYSCCSEMSLEKEVDLVKCIEPNSLPPFISILTILIIILSIMLSFGAVVRISNRIHKYLGR